MALHSGRIFPIWISLLTCSGIWAQALSVVQDARAAFDKVDTSPVPTAQDCMVCIQAHSALLPLVKPNQRYLVHYRRGYCALMSAAVSREATDFAQAAEDFNRAWESWPAGLTPSSGLLAIAGIARSGPSRTVTPEATKSLETAVNQTDCSSTALMQPAFCQDLVGVARLWLAVSAQRSGKLADASRWFEGAPVSAWKNWADGRQAAATQDWRKAALLFRQAIEAWRKAESSTSPATVDLLAPRPDLSEVAYDWALAAFRGEDYSGAAAAARVAIDRGSKSSYLWFLKGRSEDRLTQATEALVSYARAVQLADGTGDGSWAVGQAHYYRGILLFRAGKYADAATAFAAAPGAGLGDISRADVTVWADLVQLAGGDCSKAARFREIPAGLTADGFPTTTARTLWAGCEMKQATTLDQLLDLERRAGTNLAAERRNELRGRISDAYASLGVAAEDRRDIVSALAAYRNALDWNPASSKARFNLGAIYLEQRNYAQAEVQYRALSETDPSDYEAQYWLAEAILAQPPSTARRSEACNLLKRSLAVADTVKRAQFQKTLLSIRCP